MKRARLPRSTSTEGGPRGNVRCPQMMWDGHHWLRCVRQRDHRGLHEAEAM